MRALNTSRHPAPKVEHPLQQKARMHQRAKSRTRSRPKSWTKSIQPQPFFGPSAPKPVTSGCTHQLKILNNVEGSRCNPADWLGCNSCKRARNWLESQVPIKWLPSRQRLHAWMFMIPHLEEASSCACVHPWIDCTRGDPCMPSQPQNQMVQRQAVLFAALCLGRAAAAGVHAPRPLLLARPRVSEVGTCEAILHHLCWVELPVCTPGKATAHCVTLLPTGVCGQSLTARPD